MRVYNEMRAHKVDDARKRLSRRARRKLRAVPLAERAEALDGVIAMLADPASSVRRELEEHLPACLGLHPATLRAGLDCAFSAWKASGMRALVDAQLDPEGPDAAGFDCTSILCGGVLPMPGIETALDCLLLGSPVLLRPAVRDEVSARVLQTALAAAHPALAAALEVVDFANPDALRRDFEHDFAPDHNEDAQAERAAWMDIQRRSGSDLNLNARLYDSARGALGYFLDVDCVVAYGSDETVQRIAEQRPERRTVCYGHRFSVAVVARGAEQAAAPKLARDVCLWDQLGCLSPTIVWALGDADLLADALAENFAELSRVLPRGEVPLEAAARFANARAELEVRAANSAARLLGGEHWLVARETDARFRGSPLYRALPVCPARDLAEVSATLKPFARWLSTIGHAGFKTGRARADLLEACATLGPPPPRLAPIGQMQAPRLCWRHDGAGTLLPLLQNPTPLERQLGAQAV